jgi:peptide chain release factor subunit 1
MLERPPVTRDDVNRLASHTSPRAMTSCYLDVDGAHYARHQDLARATESVLRRARERINGDASLQADLDRIGDLVRSGLDRTTTRGLAVFSCEAEGFWEVLPLPSPVPSHVVVGYSPAVGPLEVALADHEPMGVLLVDKGHTRMLVCEWGELTEHAELVADLLRDYDERGEKERGDTAAKIEARVAQHLKTAARIAFDVQNRTHFGRLVIGGPEVAVAGVERLLHPYLAKAYAGRIDVGATASLDEIRRAVTAKDAEIARRTEARDVERLRDLSRTPGGLATVGLRPVLDALAAHRVERILVSHDYAENGWRCPACGTLAAVGPSCGTCGAASEPVENVVSEALDRVLAERGRVEVCVGNADLDVLGRIGAFLRF